MSREVPSERTLVLCVQPLRTQVKTVSNHTQCQGCLDSRVTGDPIVQFPELTELLTLRMQERFRGEMTMPEDNC